MRHLGKKHPGTKLEGPLPSPAEVQAALDEIAAAAAASGTGSKEGASSVRGLLTGMSYLEERKIPCLYAAPVSSSKSIGQSSAHPSTPSGSSTCATPIDRMPGEGCEYRFSRAYDLRRHLKKIHNVDVNEDEAKGLVEQIKRGFRA